MIDFLNSVKSLIKLGQIQIDNNVFRLHYKLTVIMLIVFSILLTSKQYFGDPIVCLGGENKEVLQSYCWIYGTFILKSTLDSPNNFIPGGGNAHREVTPWEHPVNEDVIWQKYYQWVCIVFCFQALLFYMPRYLWKTWEGGLLRGLCADFTGPIVPPKWTPAARAEIIARLLKGKYAHQMYAFRYSVCELFNLLNVVGQIFFMNWLLTGRFALYGFKVLFPGEGPSPMTEVFPKMTKCTFRKFGPSGSVTKLDSLCVLPLNILNEKLFLVLWFWLFVLTGLTIVSMVYRLFVIFVPKLRIYLLMAQARSLTRKQAGLIVHKMSYGDFFLVYHVGKNLNSIVFNDLVGGLQEAIKSKAYGFYPSFDALSI